jgi:DNA polymerase III subunit gamma/tau
VATLYRQYRPSSFKEVAGQDHIIETLKAAILKDRLTHAYLFHGPRGTGKTTTARLLAKRANCHDAKDEEACEKCVSCTSFATNSNIDVIEIDAASNRGIDDIRALRERVSSAPAFGKYKVYIIDEVHMLTPEASTALLKTLEEPVAHVIFILATTELHKVLPTILSRCQVFRFRRASKEELTKRLKYLLKQEKREANDDILDYIIERSDGCFRDAESLLGQLLTLQQKELKKDSLTSLLGLPPANLIEGFITAMLKGESAGAITATDKAFNEGHDPEQFIRESVIYARDQALKDVATGKAEVGKWSQIIRSLLQALQDLNYVPQPIIALHLAVLTVCTVKGETAPVQTTPEPKQEAQPITPKKIETTPVIHEQAVAPTPKPAPIKEPTPTNKPEPIKEEPIASTPSLKLDTVKKVWPQLISNVKNDNPVASTFLRAIEPIDFSNDTITLRTRYALHRNFFTTPKNKDLITKILCTLLGENVGVKLVLDENGGTQVPSLASQRKSKEDNFYSTVKEVFG